MSVHLTTTELQAPAFASRLPLLDGSGPPLRQSWACRRYQTKNVSPNRTQKYGYTFYLIYTYLWTYLKVYDVNINIYVYYLCWLCWLHLLIETVLSFCSAPCKTTGVFWHMTRYTYIHVHAYILYIYIHMHLYIYIFIYIIFIYIHSCINISIHVCVNVYTSRFITVQSLFLPSLYCQAAVSPQTFSLLLPESPPHDVLAPQHERPVGPCRDGQDLPLLLGVLVKRHF